MSVREHAPAKVAAPRGRRTAVLVVAACAFLGFCWWLWPAGYVQSDLRVYVVAARAFLRGQDIYTAHLAFPKELALGFTYPPFAALVFAPIATLGTGTGRVVMTLVNASCLLAIGVLMTRALRPAWSRERVLALGSGSARSG
ncbi:glycosyltransferase 87 family protein [Kribbella sp. NBC_00482]|uniref:glycosyltransferase 87 family protein n=1 Tax=Kribbella sp. NBC_00482 TaxID=2975968 RepID=UPI002E17EB14